MSKMQPPPTTRTATATAADALRFKIASIAISALATLVAPALTTTALPQGLRNSATRTNTEPWVFSPSSPLSKSRGVGPSYSSTDTNLNERPIQHQNQQQPQKAPLSVDSYTNYWDNLLLEEHKLATDEWKDRRNKCHIQTLEKLGLAISRAFALPDSDLLGEKTVWIHDGSGSRIVNGNRILDSDMIGVADNSDVPGDKLKSGSNKRNGNGQFRRPWNESFSKGDILVLTSNGSGGFSSSQAFRRECLVMEVGDSWMLVGVGKSWPMGVWDARKGLGSNGKRGRGSSSYGYPVRLDKTPNAAALIPLRAQRLALRTVREQHQNQQSDAMIATWLTKTTKEQCMGYYQVRNRKRWAKTSPLHFRQHVSRKKSDSKNESEEEEEDFSLEICLHEAMKRVTKRRVSKTKYWTTTANDSQQEAIYWALSRRVSSIQGPPGTGKTRVAALLIATALEMARNNNANGISEAAFKNNSIDGMSRPFRVLAVAHSNGAADVLLQALLDLGVPAVRAGRPAAISESVRHRSAVALAEKIPQVAHLREELLAATTSFRSNIEWELHRCIDDAQNVILDSAPVIVTSCIGAYQLSARHEKLKDEECNRRQQQDENQEDSERTSLNKDNDVRFPLVVLDEAAQCTEPALMCALVAARAEQLVMVGDTKQLPPTVASSSKALRESLGISPMERLEKCGLVEQKTLQIQYRMVQTLLEHPSKYFYNGMVKSAVESSIEEKAIENESLVVGACTTVEEDLEHPPAGFDWPNPSMPLAFISVGKGDAEVLHESSIGLSGRSNPREGKFVAKIVANILESGDLKSSQICVLTPYSKQVAVIRSALENESLIRRHRNTILDPSNEDITSNLDSNQSLSSSTVSTAIFRSISNVSVGTIDSFQGQETEVVIFSAVRSNSFSELGFLRDPRRLCVALTRARKGLILLGDATVLNSCRHWKSLIESCRHRNCFINEEHLFLPIGSYNGDGDDSSKDSTSIGDTILSGNESDDKAVEREKLSLLKPDEEFLGLFPTPRSNSK